MFSAGAGVFFPEPEFFFAGAGAGGEKPGVCTALKNTHLTTIYKTEYLITTRHLTEQITRLITRQTYRFPCLDYQRQKRLSTLICSTYKVHF